jgi:hypothetical protein
MKRILLVSVMAMLPTATVLSQTQDAAPPKPATEPMAEKAAKPEGVKLAAGADRRSGAKDDARHCLEFTANTEIIKCAEPYRLDRKK